MLTLVNHRDNPDRWARSLILTPDTPVPSPRTHRRGHVRRGISREGQTNRRCRGAEEGAHGQGAGRRARDRPARGADPPVLSAPEHRQPAQGGERQEAQRDIPRVRVLRARPREAHGDDAGAVHRGGEQVPVPAAAPGGGVPTQTVGVPQGPQAQQPAAEQPRRAQALRLWPREVLPTRKRGFLHPQGCHAVVPGARAVVRLRAIHRRRRQLGRRVHPRRALKARTLIPG